MFRIRWWMIACLFMSLAVPATAQSDNDAPAAQAMLGQINAWRIQLGLWPLKLNDTLTAMAVDQADYLSTLKENIPSGNAMHLGRFGEGPRERAQYPQFGWPAYGRQSEDIAEIAAIGTQESALKFWHESPVHTQVATNTIFREIGVAAVPHPWGHIYIVVFGGRPDVLPALYDPQQNVLYLTQDVFKFGPGNVPAMQVTLFDAAGRPLNNGQPLPWSPTLPVPPNTGGKLYVLYNDGSAQALAEVDLREDQAVLPEEMPAGAG
jgi:uncharacterized protein YkwD